jgi:hypothetical protein
MLRRLSALSAAVHRGGGGGGLDAGQAVVQALDFGHQGGVDVVAVVGAPVLAPVGHLHLGGHAQPPVWCRAVSGMMASGPASPNRAMVGHGGAADHLPLVNAPPVANAVVAPRI